MSGLRYMDGVVTLRFDEQRCNGCRECTRVCPHAVFEMRGRRAAIVDRDACMECGACVLNCASEALAVRPGVGCAFTVVKSFFGRSPAPERDVA